MLSIRKKTVLVIFLSAFLSACTGLGLPSVRTQDTFSFGADKKALALLSINLFQNSTPLQLHGESKVLWGSVAPRNSFELLLENSRGERFMSSVNGDSGHIGISLGEGQYTIYGLRSIKLNGRFAGHAARLPNPVKFRIKKNDKLVYAGSLSFYFSSKKIYTGVTKYVDKGGSVEAVREYRWNDSLKNNTVSNRKRKDIPMFKSIFKNIDWRKTKLRNARV